ncbi:MAG TPA: branched-chain amino acid ABC transporter permease [Acidimicrobiales bacterium]|nr:branched-chain amino acid ABC transporter permease [Acidimicrobiales bacterium]
MTDIFGGLATGAVVALIALSLVIIWQSTHVLNFAQGAMGMFATFVGMNLVFHGLNYWLCLVLSVVTGMVLGGVTERVLIRPLYGKPEINPIVVMIGFLGVIEAVIASIWTTNITMLPSPFSQIYYQSAGHTILVSPFIFYEVAVVAAVVIAIALLFRRTNLGLQMRAAALAPEVSRLLGVRVGRLLTLGWILSTGVGTLAAVVVSTGQVLAPTNMDGIFVSAFIAAAVGGLESPLGAIVAGLAIGLTEQFILDFWSTSIAPLSGVIVLVIGLSLRPQGLFTKHVSRRV